MRWIGFGRTSNGDLQELEEPVRLRPVALAVQVGRQHPELHPAVELLGGQHAEAVLDRVALVAAVALDHRAARRDLLHRRAGGVLRGRLQLLVDEAEDDRLDRRAVDLAEVEQRHAQLVHPVRLEPTLVVDARVAQLEPDPVPPRVLDVLVRQDAEVELVQVLAALVPQRLADRLLGLEALDVVAPEAAAVAHEAEPDLGQRLDEVRADHLARGLGPLLDAARARLRRLAVPVLPHLLEDHLVLLGPPDALHGVGDRPRVEGRVLELEEVRDEVGVLLVGRARHGLAVGGRSGRAAGCSACASRSCSGAAPSARRTATSR